MTDSTFVGPRKEERFSLFMPDPLPRVKGFKLRAFARRDGQVGYEVYDASTGRVRGRSRDFVAVLARRAALESGRRTVVAEDMG